MQVVQQVTFPFSISGKFMNLGKALTLCRNQKGLTKTQLSERTGLSISYITLLEQGKRDPNISTIESISSAMNIPISIFIFLASDHQEKAGMSEALVEKLSHAALSLIDEHG